MSKEMDIYFFALLRTLNEDVDDIPSLRLPDTVIFQLGQPLQWYFTSCRSRQPSILRKKKKNVNTEKIEQDFIKKSQLLNKGTLDPNDIIAYFIAYNEKNAMEDNKRKDPVCGHHTNSSINEPGSDVNLRQDKIFCNIEYFNEISLRE